MVIYFKSSSVSMSVPIYSSPPPSPLVTINSFSKSESVSKQTFFFFFESSVMVTASRQS